MRLYPKTGAVIFLLAVSPNASFIITGPIASLENENLAHAREILGNEYDSNLFNEGMLLNNIDQFVRTRTDASLKGKWKNHSATVSNTILSESGNYGFDPVFLMAIIDHESGFSPDRVGTHGEIGLMQIMPDTADWVAHKLGLTYYDGPASLFNPVVNIKLGTAYLSLLRKRYSSESYLYLAAYNMGHASLTRALQKKVLPKAYRSMIVKKYLGLYSRLTNHTTRPSSTRIAEAAL